MRLPAAALLLPLSFLALPGCASVEPPPTAPPYCTRTLGKVDCWRQPPLAIPLPPGLADGPTELTPAQEANRTRRWPELF